MKREALNQFAAEKLRIEQEHREAVERLRETYESKIQVGRQKCELKNEKVINAERQCE